VKNKANVFFPALNPHLDDEHSLAEVNASLRKSGGAAGHSALK
jgi:hypothetical protein